MTNKVEINLVDRSDTWRVFQAIYSGRHEQPSRGQVLHKHLGGSSGCVQKQKGGERSASNRRTARELIEYNVGDCTSTWLTGKKLAFYFNN